MEYEYWAMGVCLSTPWEYGGVDEREKEVALCMSKAVGWRRSPKRVDLVK